MANWACSPCRHYGYDLYSIDSEVIPDEVILYNEFILQQRYHLYIRTLLIK